MNSINIEIERIKKKLFIERLHNELSAITENSDRYKYLNRILTDLTKTNDLNTFLSKASDDVFAKKWNKLPNYHKIQKINEYVDSICDNEYEGKWLKDKLSALVNAGKLNTCKLVVYDDVRRCITKIMLSKTEIY